MRILRGCGDAEVDGVEVDMVLLMGRELVGRRWGLEERSLQQVIDPLRMLSWVLWKKSGGLMSCMNWNSGITELVPMSPEATSDYSKCSFVRSNGANCYIDAYRAGIYVPAGLVAGSNPMEPSFRQGAAASHPVLNQRSPQTVLSAPIATS